MLHYMRVGQTYTMDAPSTVSCTKGALTLTSSNPAVATVTSSGGKITIAALTVGTAQITASVAGGTMETRIVQVFA